MLYIAEFGDNYINVKDTDIINRNYFFSIVEVDREFIDDSFDHAFGTECCGHYEYDVKLIFDECLDDDGDVITICGDQIAVLTHHAKNMLEEVDHDILNKYYEEM